MRRLELIAGLKPGDSFPQEFIGYNGWGEALSALAARAAEIIRYGIDPRIEMESGDVVKICGVRFSMGYFRHIGFGPTDCYYRVVQREKDGFPVFYVSLSEGPDIDRRLSDALITAGRSALSYPGTVDTFRAMLNDAGLALVSDCRTFMSDHIEHGTVGLRVVGIAGRRRTTHHQ